MILKAIGRGGAFAPVSVGNSNFMLISKTGKRMIIDMGTTFPYIYRDEMGLDFSDIDAVWISHLHADHNSIELFSFHRYFLPKKDESGAKVKPKLFMDKNLMEEAWENSWRGGLESLQGKIMNLTDYFDCFPICRNGAFMWEDYLFTPIQTIHVGSGYIIKNSYGLMIESPNGTKIYQTSDTQFDIRLTPFYNEADLILQDCETGKFKSIVHANYFDLKVLSENIKNKMWLYHHNLEEPTFKEDGFAGFVVKGQEFEF